MKGVQILAIVVLYKQQLEGSETVASLERSFAASPSLRESIQVMLWDNSPEPLEHTQTGFPSLYRHSRANVGLARAYNTAAQFAQESGIPWLLLLDQDTDLPAMFLDGLLTQACALLGQPEIAAVAPTVFVGGRHASPERVLFNRHTPYAGGESGIAEGEATAINSGSLLRVASLLQVGGYSDAFWLDYSDWYIYRQFYLHSMKIWHAAQLRIEHSMTVMDYDKLMSAWRYQNFIYAEGAFNDIFHGWRENAVQTLRLCARVLRQRKRFKNRVFSQITFRYLLWRLSKTRRKRIRLWNQRTAERVASFDRPSS